MKSRRADDVNRLKKIVDRLSSEDGEYICKVVFRDPLTDIYPILLIIYVLILGIFLLWPFDFVSLVRNDVRWIKSSNGIEFQKIGQAVSNSSTQEFFRRMVKGSGLTLELWLQTEDLNQTGPARILSYSIDSVSRNFTIAQWRDQLVVRLRTTKTNLNGTSPQLIIADTFNSISLQHLVITYSLSEQRVYINGEQKARSDSLRGNFSNWDQSCNLVIGNEVTGNRPWIGKIYYVAVFNRPLTGQEIRQNYLTGIEHKIKEGNTRHADFRAKGPMVRYLFDEKKGDVIHDSGSDLTPVDLSMPEYIRHKIKPILGVSMDYLQSKSGFSDIIINVLIFIPLGILIQGMLRSRYRLTPKIFLAALLAGTLFSLSVESLQYLSMTRNSSLIDVATNMIGIAVGIVMYRFYILFLNVQTKHLWTQINTNHQDS